MTSGAGRGSRGRGRPDGSGVVIDVRPDDRIEDKDAEAFAAAKDACGLAGWDFRRSGVPDPVLTANVTWLARYRHPRCAGPPGLARVLLEVFAGPAPLMAGGAAAASGRNRRRSVVDAACHGGQGAVLGMERLQLRGCGGD